MVASVDRGRLVTGFVAGLGATVVMSVVMLAGIGTGVSPMPKPIPVALVGHTFEVHKPALVVLGFGAHLLYGGAAGAVFTALVGRAGLARGLGYGVLLWLVMGLVALPYLGWGLFGTGMSPGIAAATLVLHLLYGASLGWLAQIRGVRETVAAG